MAGGSLCLLDLDNNSLNHYGLPNQMQDLLKKLIKLLEEKSDFDPYAGRKLYSYLYDLGYEDIQVEMVAHHLIYGDISDLDMFNWITKARVASMKNKGLFKKYPGGNEGFVEDFRRFLKNPRRFTYTPLVVCKGVKPA